MADWKIEKIDRKLAFRTRTRGGWTQLQLFLKDDRVSWLGIKHLEVRIGEAVLKLGGIAGVGTEYSHRRRGYSRRCLTRAVEMMPELGFDISGLWGIPDYYYRWGYASTIPKPILTIATRDAEQSVPAKGCRVVKYRHQVHYKPVHKIFTENNSTRTMTMLRHAKEWSGRWLGSHWGVPTEVFVILNRGGRVVAYAAYDKPGTEMLVTEIGCAKPEYFANITYELAKRAVRRRTGEVRFFVPADHPYAEYLQRWDAEHKVKYAKAADGMARIVKLGTAIKKCEGELSRRLKVSPACSSRFSLCLDTDIGRVSVAGSSGRIKVTEGRGGKTRVKMPQHVLMQLLAGYRSVGNAIGLDSVKIPAAATAPMEALFPRGCPFVWPADKY